MTKMRYPSGPFIELNFYFSERSDVEMFHQFILVVLDRGAKLTGHGYIHRGPRIRDEQFTGSNDHSLIEVRIEELTDLDNCFNNLDKRLVKVYLDRAIGLRSDAFEIATLVRISKEASIKDHHPIALWAEGATFSGPEDLMDSLKIQRLQEGKIIYEYFCDIVESLKPSYAAITVEEPLKCPTDLRKDPRSLAFEDFYISGEYIGDENLGLIKHEFSHAYIEPIAEGLYISTYKYMNPDNIGLDNLIASDKSIFVANLIGDLKGKN